MYIWEKNLKEMGKYAIGMQDFGSIRKDGYIYVDKTSYIPLLLNGSKYYFLARPRRFGKSLFLSTLEYFFSGERELFKGLAVDNFNWNWETYPIIHIDLNGADYTHEGTLEERLRHSLSELETRYGILIEEASIQQHFRTLISALYEKTRQKVVVLVDEYDKPILDTLDHPHLNVKYKDTLRSFYGVMKSLDKYLKFVFLTGVTKFGQMNIFSGLNNIRDISLLDEYGAICGITQQEIVSNFSEGINFFAIKKNIDPEKVIELLKENYDGYHFSRNCPDIYNPYSLLNALDASEISAYWSFTGTPNLLVNLLLKNDYNIEDLNGIMASEERLIGINNSFEDPVALFFQTGYLTIKNYDEELQEFILGFPNREVEKAFFGFILPFYLKKRTQSTDSFISNFNGAIIKGDPKKAMEYLEAFSSSISYDLIPAPDVERHFQSMIYIIVKLIATSALKVNAEWKTSDGRIDLLIETPKFVYIIEMKRDSSPEMALNQIKEKKYALPFRDSSRDVFLIGVNFSTKKRCLDRFAIESLDSNDLQ